MSQDTIHILLVEDDPDDAFLIREMLSEAERVEFELTHVQRLSKAVTKLKHETFNLVLLDLTLPDSMGMETFYELSKDAIRTPIVVLTGLDDEQTGMEAMRAGAQDYLLKGEVNADLLIRAARYAIERHRLEYKLSDALERLDREFEIIANVQNNLLPSEVPDIPGYDVTTYYQPAEWAGGDYFDFLPIGSSNMGILLADVSGRGAPAAVLMAMTRVIVHEENDWIEPEKVLSTLNEQLSANIPAGRFVTANYGVLNYEEGTFNFACAGHTPPLVFNPATNSAYYLEVESKMPLGIKRDTLYDSNEVQLTQGAALVMYTDGVTTAQNAEGKAFGQERLARSLERNKPENPEDIRNTILDALREHTGEEELTDDTTLVILQTKKQ